jgi:Leucine Rich repeat
LLQVNLTDLSAPFLSKLVGAQPKLRELSLQRNNIGEACMHALTMALSGHTGCLSILNLNWNHIGDSSEQLVWMAMHGVLP